MRASLLEAWPGLSMHFGLRPDVAPYELSQAELLQYVYALRDLDDEITKMRRNQSHRR